MECYCLNFLFMLASILGYSSAFSIPLEKPCEDILSPECLKETVQASLPIVAKGIPELGIEPLDPYFIKELHLKLPGGIEIDFSHGYARGMRKCIVDFARYVNHTFESELHCNLTIKGLYKSSGKLFMFPIDGEGESTIKCTNIKLHSVLKLGSVVKPDGKRYVVIKSAKVDHSYDGRISYNMTNLFRGNPEISDAVLDFMNNNWKLVAQEFGTPMVEYGVKSVMKNIKRLFDVVPIDKLKEL